MPFTRACPTSKSDRRASATIIDHAATIDERRMRFADSISSRASLDALANN